MSAVNVTVIGNVGQTPVLRVSNSGIKWTAVRVATTRRQQVDGMWQDGPTIWFDVKAFGSKAQNAVESLEKGTPVIVVGRLGVEEYKSPSKPDTFVDSAPAERRSSLVIQNATIAVDLSRGVAKWQRVIHTDAVTVLDSPTQDSTVRDSTLRDSTGAPILALEPPKQNPFERDNDGDLAELSREFDREPVAA